MTSSQSAFSMMKDLRVAVDRRLQENEDYRALKALDKAILEVKIGSEVAHEDRNRLTSAGGGTTNPVGDVQNQVAARFGA